MKTIFTAACILLLAACNKPADKPTPPAQKPQQEDNSALLPGEGSDSADLATFMELSDFHIFKLQLPESLAGDSLNIHIREFRKGILTDSSTFGGALSFHRSRWLRCYGRKVNDGLVQFYTDDTILPFELVYELPAKADKGKYRWTELYNLHKPTLYSPGREIPFLFYGTAPIEEGKCVYCQLPETKENYRDWYRQFSVEHYWIVSLSILPTQDNTP